MEMSNAVTETETVRHTHTYHTVRFCGASAVSSVTSVQPRVTWSECCCCGCCYCRLHFYRHVTACVTSASNISSHTHTHTHTRPTCALIMDVRPFAVQTDSGSPSWFIILSSLFRNRVLGGPWADSCEFELKSFLLQGVWERSANVCSQTWPAKSWVTPRAPGFLYFYSFFGLVSLNSPE